MCGIKVQGSTWGTDTTTNDYFNEEEEYKVEEVVKHRKQGRKTQYLMH